MTELKKITKGRTYAKRKNIISISITYKPLETTTQTITISNEFNIEIYRNKLHSKFMTHLSYYAYRHTTIYDTAKMITIIP